MQAEKILDKPGKIDLAKFDPATIPLAGRMGELGQLILKGKMRKDISTGPMGENQFKFSEPRTVRGRFKPGQQPARIDKIGIDQLMNIATNNEFEDANFGFLHKIVPKTTKTSVNNLTEIQPYRTS